MIDIVDKRNNKKKASQNRQRFLKRYKRQLQKKVNNIGTNKKGITDFDKDEEVNISKDDLSEPTFHHRANSGKRDIVLPGNKDLQKGDRINKPDEEAGGGGGGGHGEEDSEGEFTFTLTKEEFMDLYFSDMALPRFIKEGLKNSSVTVRRRAGYVKEGIPAKLNLKKSFENAIARKIIAKSRKKKARFLDDTDLRYDYYKQENVPKKHAVMFCLLDVSGSMQDHERMVAKKFFLLLYLFLEKSYDSIEVRFIVHTTYAEEVSEDEFFQCDRTGGTIISSALECADNIIDKEYDLNTTNIYMAQISDGDNFMHDNEPSLEILQNQILRKVQYYVYVQVETENIYYMRDGSDYGFYKAVQHMPQDNCNSATIYSPDQVYPVLRDLFKAEQ